MAKWLCTRAETKERPAATLVVEVEHWHDARNIAARRLDVPIWEEMTVVQCSEDHRPDVKARWIGGDYNPKGNEGPRRQEISVRVGDEFGEWEAAA